MAPSHDDDAVTQSQQLIEIVRDQDHRDPFASEPIDLGVELLLGADVDTRRGLVEDKNAGTGGHGAREDDLLLVAAR